MNSGPESDSRLSLNSDSIYRRTMSSVGRTFREQVRPGFKGKNAEEEKENSPKCCILA